VGAGFLDIAERDPGVEGGRDERVPQGVRADLLGNPGASGHPADDAGGSVPVEALAVEGEEQRARGALADGQVDGAGGPRGERDGDDLAALAGDDQGPVAAFQAQELDVGPGGLRYAQAVEGEQGDQGVLGGRAEPGGDQECADLVAVQGGGVRLLVQPGAADVRGGRVVEEFLFHGVPVEPRDGGQPPGDGGAPGPVLRVRGRRSLCRRGGLRTAPASGRGTSR
jgi:hypothetical protein